jgi:hypothetical protein
MTTPLLSRLESWTKLLAIQPLETPRLVLLVGAPGNGKTEAIESTISWLDQSLACGGALKQRLKEQLLPSGGKPVPRVAQAEVACPQLAGGRIGISIVQDASVEQMEKSRAALLVEELARAIADCDDHRIYLACVNRGVLDDAMIHATEHGPATVLDLILAIIQAVGQGVGNTACWPLNDFSEVAVWPMDVESLMVTGRESDSAPVASILANAIDESKWLPHGACPAKLNCPFCGSRKLLALERNQAALIQILRWHELATAKRWTFRDLFSLTSFLLAGTQTSGSQGGPRSPCGWAAELLELDSTRLGRKPDGKRSVAIFELASSLYQHQLFGLWDARAARQLRDDIREVGLISDHTAIGLVHFLRKGRGSHVPSLISELLVALCNALDPAMADSQLEVQVSGNTRLRLRDIDARFSQSVASGREFLAKYRCLAPLEMELLGRLAELDRVLSSPEHRRRRPDAATRIQHLVRDFSCRWVRRSLCAKAGVVLDGDALSRYQCIVEDRDHNGELIHEAAREVGRLLNSGDKFEVSLTTTFGQPMPPPQIRAVLITPKQSVKPSPHVMDGRPLPSLRHLRVGRGTTEQTLALTFDLFRSVRLLSQGMSPASLPREVVALIDTTKARLAGPVVRNDQELDDSVIIFGTSGSGLALVGGRFVPIKGVKL